MVLKIKTLLAIFCLTSCAVSAFDKTNTLFSEKKMNELCSPFRQDGFITYKRGDLQMERNTEYPIIVELQENRWYQFCALGDPSATKIEFKLSSPETGNLVTDKFHTQKTGEYWTSFSFICPRSGKYLITFYQKSDTKKLSGYLTILQRPVESKDGYVYFKH
jgi:hypothetical protein